MPKTLFTGDVRESDTPNYGEKRIKVGDKYYITGDIVPEGAPNYGEKRIEIGGGGVDNSIGTLTLTVNCEDSQGGIGYYFSELRVGEVEIEGVTHHYVSMDISTGSVLKETQVLEIPYIIGDDLVGTKIYYSAIVEGTELETVTAENCSVTISADGMNVVIEPNANSCSATVKAIIA